MSRQRQGPDSPSPCDTASTNRRTEVTRRDVTPRGATRSHLAVTHDQRLRTRRVDCERAHAVAAAFLDAPRASTSAIVHAAYADLGAQAHRWFARLTGSSARTPIRVVHTRCHEPYATGQELAERV